jgi:hypothetical protein
MDELIRSLSQSSGVALGAVLGSLGIIGVTLISVISVAMSEWRKVRETESVAALKQQMLDRGMTADDIVKVVGVAPSMTPEVCVTPAGTFTR